jgi:hypothetical protein
VSVLIPFIVHGFELYQPEDLFVFSGSLLEKEGFTAVGYCQDYREEEDNGRKDEECCYGKYQVEEALKEGGVHTGIKVAHLIVLDLSSSLKKSGGYMKRFWKVFGNTLGITRDIPELCRNHLTIYLARIGIFTYYLNK